MQVCCDRVAAAAACEVREPLQRAGRRAAGGAAHGSGGALLGRAQHEPLPAAAGELAVRRVRDRRPGEVLERDKEREAQPQLPESAALLRCGLLHADSSFPSPLFYSVSVSHRSSHSQLLFYTIVYFKVVTGDRCRCCPKRSCTCRR